jgi:hypothetical protein
MIHKWKNQNTMNNIKNILNALVNDVENERIMTNRTIKYLHRVKIVRESIALTLLRQTADALQERVDSILNILSIIARDSKLNIILQHMQTSIAKLESKSSYFDAIRKKVESTSLTRKKITKKMISSSDRKKQIREFIVNVINVMKQKIMKIMFTKNIMIKLQNEKKSIREIIKLINKSIRIQTEFEKIRKILQEKTEIIKRLVVSITIQIRIYLVRINEIKIDHINVINQTNAISYLQAANFRLHSSLRIIKIAWSRKIIRKKKTYSILHVEIETIQQINRIIIEKLMKNYEIKQCELFTRNCTITQCFNCHKYEHIEKWCKVFVACEMCAKQHRIADCDLTITICQLVRWFSDQRGKRSFIPDISHWYFT